MANWPEHTVPQASCRVPGSLPRLRPARRSCGSASDCIYSQNLRRAVNLRESHGPCRCVFQRAESRSAVTQKAFLVHEVIQKGVICCSCSSQPDGLPTMK